MDDAAGLRDTDVVYVDTNSEQFEGLPETALHRPVDLAVVGADKEGLFSLWLFHAADYNAVQAMRERTSSYLQLYMESRLGNFTTLAFPTVTRFRFPSRSRRVWTEARVE
jgi:hypothetical protein